MMANIPHMVIGCSKNELAIEHRVGFESKATTLVGCRMWKGMMAMAWCQFIPNCRPATTWLTAGMAVVVAAAGYSSPSSPGITFTIQPPSRLVMAGYGDTTGCVATSAWQQRILKLPLRNKILVHCSYLFILLPIHPLRRARFSTPITKSDHALRQARGPRTDKCTTCAAKCCSNAFRHSIANS